MQTKKSTRLFTTLEEECRRIGKTRMAKGMSVLLMTREEFRRALSRRFWTMFFPKDIDYESPIRMTPGEFVHSLLVRVNFIGREKIYVEFVKP